MEREFSQFNCNNRNDMQYYNKNRDNKGYIDVEDNVFIRIIVDACNLLGANYRGFQRGWVRHPIERGRFLWFPKIDYGRDWDNKISNDGLIIRERRREESITWVSEYFTYPNYNVERVTFTGEMNSSGQYGYRFRGVFLIDEEATKREGVAVHRRIDTRVKTYK